MVFSAIVIDVRLVKPLYVVNIRGVQRRALYFYEDLALLGNWDVYLHYFGLSTRACHAKSLLSFFRSLNHKILYK